VAAVLLDMDGVLADVSLSYRVCVTATAARYGVTVTQRDIVAAKATGLYNNDWVLTHHLVRKVCGDLSQAFFARLFGDLFCHFLNPDFYLFPLAPPPALFPLRTPSPYHTTL
jgi:hypothetical protein